MFGNLVVKALSLLLMTASGLDVALTSGLVAVGQPTVKASKPTGEP